MTQNISPQLREAMDKVTDARDTTSRKKQTIKGTLGFIFSGVKKVKVDNKPSKYYVTLPGEGWVVARFTNLYPAFGLPVELKKDPRQNDPEKAYEIIGVDLGQLDAYMISLGINVQLPAMSLEQLEGVGIVAQGLGYILMSDGSEYNSVNPAAIFLYLNGSNMMSGILNLGNNDIVNIKHMVLGNTVVNPSAIFEIASTDGGILIPRLNTGQISGISSPSTSLLIFNVDMNEYQWYNGSAWVSFAGTAPPATTRWEPLIFDDDIVIFDHDIVMVEVDI